jgi:hypothetical protein
MRENDIKEIFNQYKLKIKWEKLRWEDFSNDEINEIINELAQVEKYRYLNRILEKPKSIDKIIEEIKQHNLSTQVLKDLPEKYQRKLLWNKKGLTNLERRDMVEKIAPEIVRKYERLRIDDGKIYIITSVSLAPFFEEKIEREFYKVRLHKDWGEFVGFDKKGKNTLLKKVNGIFTHDEDERLSEKIGYRIESFRGITYEELVTPIYKFNKEEFQEKKGHLIKEEEINNWVFSQDENENETYKKTLKDVLEKINEEIIRKDWIIKIKITKDGLATIFFEKEMKKKDDGDINIIDYAEEVKRLINKSYLIEGLKCENESVSEIERKYRLINENKLLESEGIFSSLLNAAAIWITYILLREYKVYEKVAEILDKKKKWTDDKDYLKYPWNVRYISFDSFSQKALPLRNYFIVYHFHDIKGEAWGFDSPLSIEDHFDCPGKISVCPKREECFIRIFGNFLLSLSINTYKVYDGQYKGEFPQKEIENLAKRNLARWRGELCLVESEAVIICSPKDLRICMAGENTEYDRYWENIIKGFSLLLECKTLAQIVDRLLYECMWQFRNGKRIEKAQEVLRVISNLLSRTRLTATPSNIARATYVRDKFEEFRKVVGLPGIIDNVEKDYQEINEAVRSSIDSKTTEALLKLTFLLIPLTFLIAVGTISLFYNDEVKGGRIGLLNILFSDKTLIATAIFIVTIPISFFIIYRNGWLKIIFNKLKKWCIKGINDITYIIKKLIKKGVQRLKR